jgi:hypothetical protein
VAKKLTAETESKEAKGAKEEGRVKVGTSKVPSIGIYCTV